MRGRRRSLAEAIRQRELHLRCEPGRALLDGCGMTAARVAFRKQRGDGTWLIGVEMNRTQCRSGSDDFLVDPLLIRPQTSGPTRPDRAHRGISRRRLLHRARAPDVAAAQLSRRRRGRRHRRLPQHRRLSHASPRKQLPPAAAGPQSHRDPDGRAVPRPDRRTVRSLRSSRSSKLTVISWSWRRSSTSDCSVSDRLSAAVGGCSLTIEKLRGHRCPCATTFASAASRIEFAPR